MSNLIVLCASHLDCPDRIEHLLEMIKCYITQSFKVPFFLSLSYNPTLKEAIRELLKAFVQTQDKLPFKFFVQKGHVTQWEHYKFLTTKVRDADVNSDPWIMFTDDDALWHPDRIGIYHMAVKSMKSPFDIIVVPGYTYGEEFINDPMDVDKYFLCSCQLSKLKDFVNRCEPLHLAHQYCSAMFMRYLHSSSKRWTYDSTPTSFYTHRHMGDKITIKVPPTLYGVFLDVMDKYKFTKGECAIVWDFTELTTTTVFEPTAKRIAAGINKSLARKRSKPQWEGMNAKEYRAPVRELLQLDYFKKLMASPRWPTT
jgi:hypothetical protein